MNTTKKIIEGWRATTGNTWTSMRYKTFNAVILAITFMILQNNGFFPSWMRGAFFLIECFYIVRFIWCDRNDHRERRVREIKFHRLIAILVEHDQELLKKMRNHGR